VHFFGSCFSAVAIFANLLLLLQANVLAPYAEATVNHRIHPSQTVSEVLKSFTVASLFPAPVGEAGDIVLSGSIRTYICVCDKFAVLRQRSVLFKHSCLYTVNHKKVAVHL